MIAGRCTQDIVAISNDWITSESVDRSLMTLLIMADPIVRANLLQLAHELVSKNTDQIPRLLQPHSQRTPNNHPTPLAIQLPRQPGYSVVLQLFPASSVSSLMAIS